MSFLMKSPQSQGGQLLLTLITLIHLRRVTFRGALGSNSEGGTAASVSDDIISGDVVAAHTCARLACVFRC